MTVVTAVAVLGLIGGCGGDEGASITSEWTMVENVPPAIGSLTCDPAGNLIATGGATTFGDRMLYRWLDNERQTPPYPLDLATAGGRFTRSGNATYIFLELDAKLLRLEENEFGQFLWPDVPFPPMYNGAPPLIAAAAEGDVVLAATGRSGRGADLLLWRPGEQEWTAVPDSTHVQVGGLYGGYAAVNSEGRFVLTTFGNNFPHTYVGDETGMRPIECVFESDCPRVDPIAGTPDGGAYGLASGYPTGRGSLVRFDPDGTWRVAAELPAEYSYARQLYAFDDGTVIVFAAMTNRANSAVSAFRYRPSDGDELISLFVDFPGALFQYTACDSRTFYRHGDAGPQSGTGIWRFRLPASSR